MGKTIFGQRLAKLRVEKGLTQQELAEEMSVFINSKKTISPLTISSYEIGTKNPPLVNIIFFSTYFNVSADYLLGLTDEPLRLDKTTNTEFVQKEKENPLAEPDVMIRPQDWKKYQGYPVFVVSPDTKAQNRWGILDYEKHRIVFVDTLYPLSTELKLYRYRPIESAFMDVNFKLPLTMAEILNSKEPLWIEVLSTEGYLRGKYNGWYTHNSDKSALINMSNSLMLMYEGCGISFNAYTGK